MISDDECGRDYKKGYDCNHFQKNALVDSIYDSIKIELNDILSEDIPSQKKLLLKIKYLIENKSDDQRNCYYIILKLAIEKNPKTLRRTP